MLMHRQTRTNIRQLMVQHDISSERQLALDCSMSQSTLHRFMKGETEHLDFVHLQSIAHRFSLTVSQLIGETTFSVDPKIRSVIAAMEHMPEYKKDMLVAASSSLVEPEAKHGNGK